MRSHRAKRVAPLLCTVIGVAVGLAGCERLAALTGRTLPATTATPTPTPTPTPLESPAIAIPSLPEMRTFSGEITAAQGLVRVRRRGSPHFLYAREGFPLRQGDRVMTGETSSATVSYAYGNTPIVVTLPALTFFVIQPSVPLPVLGQRRLMLTDVGPISEIPLIGREDALGNEGGSIQSGGDREATKDAGNQGPTRVGGSGLAMLYQAEDIELGLPRHDLVLLGRKFPFRYVLALPKPMPFHARVLLRRERASSPSAGAGTDEGTLIEVAREATSIAFVIPRPGEYVLQVFSVDGLARSRSYRIRARPPSEAGRTLPLLPGRRVLLP